MKNRNKDSLQPYLDGWNLVNVVKLSGNAAFLTVSEMEGIKYPRWEGNYSWFFKGSLGVPGTENSSPHPIIAEIRIPALKLFYNNRKDAGFIPNP